MNYVKINYFEVKDIIKSFYGPNSMPVLLLGSPGVGKTHCVRTSARELAQEQGKIFVDWADLQKLPDERSREEKLQKLGDPENVFLFIDLSLQSREPVDLIGSPRLVELEAGPVTSFATPDWVAHLQKYQGILFLDEVTNIQRKDIQSVLLKITQDRLVGEKKLSSQVMIILAGNKPDETGLANMLPLALLNRVMLFEFKRPSAEEWYEYIKEVHATDYSSTPFMAEVAAYLAALAAKEETPDEEKQETWASPRACENLYRCIANMRMRKIPNSLSQSMVDKVARAVIGYKEGGLFAQAFKSAFIYQQMVDKGLTEDGLRNIKDIGVYYQLATLVAKQFSSKVPKDIKENNINLLFSKMPEVINVFLQELGVFTKNSCFEDSYETLAKIAELMEGVSSTKLLRAVTKINNMAKLSKIILEGELPVFVSQQPIYKKIVSVAQSRLLYLIEHEQLKFKNN